MNLGAGRNHVGARGAEFHFTEDAAADAQVRADAITSRRFDREYRPRDFDIIESALFERNRADVYIIRRSFDAAIVNRQPDAGDVDAAGLRAQRIGRAHLCFLDIDDAGAAAVVNIDLVHRDAVESGIRGFNLARLRARDGRGRRSVFDFHAQVFGLDALPNLRVCRRQTAAHELGR